MRTGVALCLLTFLPQTPAAPVPSHGAAPVVSPDGRWIAFSANRDGVPAAYVIHPDGSGERRVSASAPTKGGLRWSADGRRLLFSSFSNNAGHLFSVDLDGSNEHEILTVPGRDPQLSPDGRRVIYGGGSFTATELMVADVNGSAIENPRRINTGTPTAWNAKWSPDGSTIAFTGRTAASDQLQVWVMKSDGSDSHALTNVLPDEGGAQLPSWSPDGRSIAIQTNAANHSAHVWVVDVASRRATKLLSHSDVYLDEIPTWFPDGKRLAFQSSRTGRLEVWTVNVDGTGVRQVTK